jgi:hypothetical protein
VNVDLVNPTVAEKVALAAEQEIIKLTAEIAKLAKQKEAIGARCAVLVAENAELGLRLASQELTHLSERFDLSQRVKALESQADNSAQIVQGLVLTPTRDEFDGLKERVDGLCAREVV